MPSRLSRREFLAGTGVVAAAAKVVPDAMAIPFDVPGVGKDHFPLGFSTLGCPAWSWNKILDFAKEYGFLGVELRGVQGNMDLPTSPEFSPSRIAQSKREV